MKSTRRREPKRRARTQTRRERLQSGHEQENNNRKETRGTRDKEKKGPQPGVYPWFIALGPAPFLPPFPRLVLSPAPLRASPRSLSKGNSRSFLCRGERQKGGKPARIVRCFSIHGPYAAFPDPSQRGKARSVARGGWRSECHEWW